MWRVLEKFHDFFDFVLGVLYIGALPSLFVGLYSYLVIHLMVIAAAEWQLGIFVWAIPTAMLTPVILVWYSILHKRYKAYVDMLMSSQPMKWDIDAAIKGWQELHQFRKKKKKT